jgi:ketosteroid isomerase-like protein
MLTRRVAIGAAAAFTATVPIEAFGQTMDATAVNAAVEELRKAMLTADKAKLTALTADQMSYGHSSGKVETKAQFIDVVANRKTTYKSISHEQSSTTVVGNNAVVRHNFVGESETDGKSSPIKIGILQVWVKQGGAWKLLARQAVKI